MLWIGLAFLSAGVLAVLIRPLIRPRGDARASEHQLAATAIYREQLREIEAEQARGAIAVGEAEAARTEIARRLLMSDVELAASRSSAPAAANDVLVHRIAFGLAAGLPIAAIAIYIFVGSPTMPGQPLAARSAGPAATAEVMSLVQAVEARLRQHPEDGKGWDVIAPVYMKIGRYAEAAEAFLRASRILGQSSRRLAGFAEATVLASDGTVTEPARQAYEQLARLEPDRVEPRYWLALAKEQEGRLEAAAADYQALLAAGPPDAPWRADVNERLDIVREKLGKPGTAGSAGAPATARGPTAADIEASKTLSGAERRDMIEGMVQGLATRLKSDGRDLAGWERLIRAYSVMGRKADAVAALGAARQNFKDEPQPLAQLAELARSLGLDS